MSGFTSQVLFTYAYMRYVQIPLNRRGYVYTYSLTDIYLFGLYAYSVVALRWFSQECRLVPEPRGFTQHVIAMSGASSSQQSLSKPKEATQRKPPWDPRECLTAKWPVSCTGYPDKAHPFSYSNIRARVLCHFGVEMKISGRYTEARPNKPAYGGESLVDMVLQFYGDFLERGRRARRNDGMVYTFEISRSFVRLQRKFDALAVYCNLIVLVVYECDCMGIRFRGCPTTILVFECVARLRSR